jgi:uncharacterized protein
MAVRSEAFFATIHPSTDPFPERFGLWHAPTGEHMHAAHSVVVHVHAFTEEMNKSRRMVAAQARSLAAQGHAVLQLDLLGCGDSPGDFVDATWDRWLSDVCAACELAVRRFEQTWPLAAPPHLWLWGLRAGCLLANAAAAQQPAGRAWNQLYWQPQIAGKAVLQHFLRVKAASGLQASEPRAEAADPRQDWAADKIVEIAGYRVNSALAMGLERATLVLPAAGTEVLWLEVTTREPAVFLPASELTITRWRDTGRSLRAWIVKGPGFWQTTEIEDAPALIGATTKALMAARVGARATQ